MIQRLRHPSLICTVLVLFNLISVAHGQPAATLTGNDGAKMVLVPAGPFIMGSGEGNLDETPPHERDLPAFYIDVTEVTGAQYARFLRETGGSPPPHWPSAAPPDGKADQPVTNVSWFDAMRYAIWAGKRLPTEAEWEKAARGTDGRRFPWGDTPDKARANIGGEKIRPVGGHPQGASPFGCLDIAGNVWEWTADWYEPYPGTNARTIAFGRQYKVMRGGGAEYFYTLNENTGRCALRGRILPYAGEDYLGFRCAQDAGKPVYDARKLLADAEAQLDKSLPKPVALSYEAEYGGYLESKRLPLTVSGRENQRGCVRIGVPLPQGLVKDLDTLAVFGPDGIARPTQTTALTPWPDGSVRWALLDFPALAGEGCELRFAKGKEVARPKHIVKVTRQQDTISVETGTARFTFARESLLASVQAGERAVVKGSTLDLALDNGSLRAGPAERMEIEQDGPLVATVRMSGTFFDAGGSKTPLEYDLRAHLRAGSSRVNLLLTIAHMQARTGQTSDRTPMLKVVDAALRLRTANRSSQAVVGLDRGANAGPLGNGLALLQPDNLRFTLSRDGAQVAEGTRAPGWLAVRQAADWLNVGTRHFWQNCPKALAVTPDEIAIRLWAGGEPLEFEATIAKTHEIVLEVTTSAPTADKPFEMEPLRATTPPAWAAGTKAMGGELLPRCRESVARMPYWELLRESSMQRWMREMRYGLRDFGDVRHGGETKGKNAFNNLEYDVPFNFILQHLRTGHRWYLDAAEIQARHQGDIDTNHVTGQPYKHHPFHTSEGADIAHMFLRGLVAHYWLTGERRSLEVARKIGDHVALRAEHFDGFGNERQIGWGTYALSGIYEATLDRRYLDAAAKLCDKLVSEQSPHGKFRIRWDNRMSLMNGMAMNGMMSVQELTGDKELADGILRLCRRTLGFYPEYALRTLHGYAWALTQTNDPRYLDVLERTWQTCLEYLMPGNATTVEVHAWRFPWFAAKYRLFPLFDRLPERLPDYRSWSGLRLKGDRAELFLRNRTNGAASVLAILEGLTQGKLELFDAAGKTLQSADLDAENRLFQPVSLTLPPGGGVCRLRLSATNANAWQVHHDAASLITVFDPKADLLEDICPRSYGYIKPGSSEISIVFEAVGEGYHTITLYDPDGNVAGTSEQFVDFDDKGRYEVELKVPIKGGPLEGWALEVYQAKILKIQGFLPYWSSRPDELFNPEQTAD